MCAVAIDNNVSKGFNDFFLIVETGETQQGQTKYGFIL